MTPHPDLFAGLSDTDAAAIVARGSRMRLDSGNVLFRIGDEATHLYVVERGAIELRMPLQLRGQAEDVRIEECGPGHALGWSTLVPPHRFVLKATARQPTDLLVFPRDMLLPYFTSRPDVGYVVMRNVATLLGRRLQVIQAMWAREMQHILDLTHG